VHRLLLAHVIVTQAGTYTFMAGNQQSKATLTVQGEAQPCPALSSSLCTKGLALFLNPRIYGQSVPFSV
jgi:hypothetical protein